MTTTPSARPAVEHREDAFLTPGCSSDLAEYPSSMTMSTSSISLADAVRANAGLLRLQADPFLRLLVGANRHTRRRGVVAGEPVGRGLRMGSPRFEPRRAAQHIDRQAPCRGARVDPLSDGDQCRDARRRRSNASIGPSSADRRASCARLGNDQHRSPLHDQVEVQRPPPPARPPISIIMCVNFNPESRQ